MTTSKKTRARTEKGKHSDQRVYAFISESGGLYSHTAVKQICHQNRMGEKTVRRSLKRLEERGDLVRHYFGTRRDNDTKLFWIILTPALLRHKAITGELQSFTETIRNATAVKRLGSSMGVHLRTDEQTGNLRVTHWTEDDTPNFFDVEFLKWQRQVEDDEDDIAEAEGESLLLRAHAQRIISPEDSQALVQKFEAEHGHQPWAEDLRNTYPELFKQPD